MSRRIPADRGVSLIEALVALAVMSLGLLGVVGMQATLRTNADLSRQRTEAVRMAQQFIESQRAFSDVSTLDALVSTSTPTDITPSGGVASATFKRSVAAPTIASTGPQLKTVTVTVQWWDRRADSTDATDPNVQQVVMKTAIARISPELSAGLGIPSNRTALQKPRGRSPLIPRAAVDQTDGTTSRFTPSGGGGVSWVFQNDTAFITKIGSRTVNALLVSGYLRFATAASPPTGVQSERPPSTANATDGVPIVPVGGGFAADGSTLATSGGGMQVASTVPILAPGDFLGGCVVDPPLTNDGLVYQPFYCAVPVRGTGGPPDEPQPDYWTGTLHVVPRPAVVETSSGDNAINHYRVCRYTPDATTDTPVGGNDVHPLVYVRLISALGNQNYLLIRAGSGAGDAFSCPTDDTDTDLVNGDTRYQAQP